MIDSLTMQDVATYPKNPKEGLKFDFAVQSTKEANTKKTTAPNTNVTTATAKVVFIFGSNGSGKSTIAKYLNSLSNDKDSSEYQNCSQKGFDRSNEKVLVFDEDYITNNFAEDSSLPGIFSLDEKNLDIDKQIAENNEHIGKLNEQKRQIDSSIKSKDEDLQKQKKIVLDECFDKRHDDLNFFINVGLKHSGNKADHYKHIREILNNQPKEQDYNDLYSRYKKLYDSNITRINESIKIDLLDDVISAENDFDALLNEVIVAKEDVGLSKMIDELGIKQWVFQGKEFIKKSNKRCPFCQQPITDDFIAQLDKMFDESYTQKIEKIKSLKTEYVAKMDSLIACLESVAKVYNKDGTVSNIQMALRNHLDSNTKIIDAKISSPNEKKQLLNISDDITTLIKRVNADISNNNKTVAALDKNKAQLTEDIWDYLALASANEIKAYDAEHAKITNEQNKLQEQKEYLEKQIADLNSNNASLQEQTQNTTKAVNNINQILKDSGFMGFSIKEEEHKESNVSRYSIVRQNEDQCNAYKTLSEGEKRFISFLYFYQTCLGTTESNPDSKKKIIIIDDPITSMDGQALFFVSTLIDILIEKNSKNGNADFKKSDISQVFIMTHNFYFYKEVASQFRLKNACSPRRHFLIRKNENNETFIAKDSYACKQNNKDELLIEDEYSLMWSALKDAKAKSEKGEMGYSNVMIANTFRRIIETYVNFMGIGDDVWAAIKDDANKTDPVHIVKAALLTMINDGSHKVTPRDGIHFYRINTEKTDVLFAAFESIFDDIDGGKEHYQHMMNDNSKTTNK